MRQIPDLMMCLGQVSEATVRQIRKTVEDPPRVSILDAIALITGHSPTVCSHTLQHLKEAYPEVGHLLSNFRFAGRGQRDTPVADVRGIVEIIMVLPGRAAAQMRKAAANVMVRYLGGDLSLVDEVAANRLTQEQLDEDDPARLFRQTVESEALKRKREEVELMEMDGRLKRARVQAATDVARLTLGALTDLDLPVSDRDKMLCKDIITTAAFTREHYFTGTGQRLEDQDQDQDICLQKFCMEQKRSGKHIKLGKIAKALYLKDHPDFEFPQNDIFANGQIIQANRWTESMRR